MIDSRLMPCPFCGKVPRVRFPDEDGGCTILHICKFVFNPTFSSFEQAVDEWNNRAPGPWTIVGCRSGDGHHVAVTFGGAKHVKDSCRNSDEEAPKLATIDGDVFPDEMLKRANPALS